MLVKLSLIFVHFFCETRELAHQQLLDCPGAAAILEEEILSDHEMPTLVKPHLPGQHAAMDRDRIAVW